MRLHELKPRPGAKHRTKRLGQGESSGKGKTSGKGHKGQNSRSGGGTRPGFEGGQMPIHRRLPKRGFNNTDFKTNYGIVNLTALNNFEEGTKVDEALLRESGLIRGVLDGVKVLGHGEITRKLEIEADKVSESARTKIEAAGGSISIRTKKD